MTEIIDYEFKRGDTKVLRKFRPTDNNGQPLNLSEKDKIYFTMKKDEKGKAIISKTINNGIYLQNDGYYHITLEPDDTSSLPADTYKYDIELNIYLNKLFVKTLIEGEITLLQDITAKGDKI